MYAAKTHYGRNGTGDTPRDVLPLDDPERFAGNTIRDLMTIREGCNDLAIRIDEGLIQFEPGAKTFITHILGVSRAKGAMLIGFDKLYEDGDDVQELMIYTSKNVMRVVCATIPKGNPVRVETNLLNIHYTSEYKSMRGDMHCALARGA